ncbi:MAG: SIMPL domain-containing protein [Parachlamydiaceae bacterium]
MFGRWFFLLIFPFSLVLGEDSDHELKVHGIGKMMLKTNIADIKMGIEVEGKTTKQVENELASLLENLVSRLQKEQLDKLETGALEVYPEYTQSSPPEIKSYRGRVLINFTVVTADAGKVISHAFDGGANLLSQVRLRPSDENLAAAREQTLKEAAKHAMSEADIILKALDLKLKEIDAVTIFPAESMVPFYRQEMALSSAKRTSEITVLEGEQSIQSQIEIRIKFKDK